MFLTSNSFSLLICVWIPQISLGKIEDVINSYQNKTKTMCHLSKVVEDTKWAGANTMFSVTTMYYYSVVKSSDDSINTATCTMWMSLLIWYRLFKIMSWEGSGVSIVLASGKIWINYTKVFKTIPPWPKGQWQWYCEDTDHS